LQAYLWGIEIGVVAL